MKKQFLLLFSLLATVILSTSVYAQQNPPSIIYFYIYSTNGQEYSGKYWPEKTDPSKAIAMDQAAKNENPGSMNLTEGCDLQLHINLNRAVREDTTIYIKMRFDDYSSTGGVNTRAVVDLPDSIPIPSGVTSFNYPYRITHIPEAQNGGLARVTGYTTYPNGAEYSRFPDRANFYSRFTYNVEYSPRTILHKGYIKLNIKGGSSRIICSFDGGVTWVKPQDEFTDSYLDKALEAGVIYIKEPNSCHLATIPFGKGSGGIGDPGDPQIGITRAVTMPYVENAILSHEEGTYYVSSMNNFVFTIQPSGTNAGLVPVVATHRTSIPDSEGVKIEDNGDGSYTVTIIRVQQAITISIDFATGNEAIDNGNKVWADKDRLFIQVSANTIANIYQSTGVLAKSMVVSAGETTGISLPTGFYIVKLDNGKTYKVILR